MSDPPARVGHNGGPPLDFEPEKLPPGPHYCKYCRHWSPPSEWMVRAYEAFRLGLSRKRVKRPSGACDRVLMQNGKPLAFAATGRYLRLPQFLGSAAPADRAGARLRHHL